jgi:hypothetical protein
MHVYLPWTTYMHIYLPWTTYMHVYIPWTAYMHIYLPWTTYMHVRINMNLFDTRYVCIYSNIKRIIHLCLSLAPSLDIFGQHRVMWKSNRIANHAVLFYFTISLVLTPNDPSNRQYMLFTFNNTMGATKIQIQVLDH